MTVARKIDSYPVRHGLDPAEQKIIAEAAKSGNGLTRHQYEHYKREFGCSGKPIQTLLSNLGLGIKGLRKAPAPEKLPTKQVDPASVFKSLREGTAPPPPPVQQTNPNQLTNDDTESLLSVVSKMETMIAEYSTKNAAADIELYKARQEREKARHEMNQVADLRKKTAKERGEVHDLKQEVQRLTAMLAEGARKHDNSPQWLRDVATDLDPEAMRQEIRTLRNDNSMLRTQVSKIAHVRIDGTELTEDSLQYLPVDALGPLMIALHTELNRRENGGRQRQKKADNV